MAARDHVPRSPLSSVFLVTTGHRKMVGTRGGPRWVHIMVCVCGLSSEQGQQPHLQLLPVPPPPPMLSFSAPWASVTVRVSLASAGAIPPARDETAPGFSLSSRFRLVPARLLFPSIFSSQLPQLDSSILRGCKVVIV